MNPKALLPILLGGALGAAGLLQGLQWKNAAATGRSEEMAAELQTLREEIELLERENESLRSLAQGGGELSVPPTLIEFAESVIGLDFRSSPMVHQVAGEELADRITAAIESRFPPNSLDHRQQAWSAIGLLNPNDRYAAQLAVTRSLGARSWFDDQTGEAWVTDRFDTNSIPDQAALLRALARILLHQHYPPPAGYLGDDADRARTALHHGAAMAVENRFLARQALGRGFTGSMDDGGASRELLASLPVFIRGLATFPSQLGLPRANRLMEQEELLGTLHEPPVLTATYFPDQEDLEITLPVLPEQAGEQVLQESLGMLGLQLWLATLDPEWADLATAWRGDRFTLQARSDTQLDLLWHVQLADEASATRILEAARTMIGVIAGLDEDPAAGEFTATPDGRRMQVEQIGPTLIQFRNLGPGDE
ncbi:hypothetical protein [Haloferula rosea]|uniref:Uncharacterized protein n=1 Tax=Haloferula rosea TaxID=490093 RepID=A0A934VFQ9_9BACT|nr:hypothetical protein [Haloferula rosea]MBK1827252.1 hypothetical protein [Haloferula rosea]